MKTRPVEKSFSAAPDAVLAGKENILLKERRSELMT